MIDDCRRLAGETLNGFSGLGFPGTGGDWGTLSISFLDEAHRRVRSIRLLVDEDLDGSLILLRSLFELAVTVDYIAKDPDARIAVFKQRLPASDSQLEDHSQHRDFFLRSLPNVKNMCEDLGDWAMKYYDSALYKYTSDAAHSGAWTLYRNLGHLIDAKPPDGVDQCHVIATSANLFLHVAKHALEFYSEMSLVGEWERLNQEWDVFWSNSVRAR